MPDVAGELLPGCYSALNLSEAGFTSQEWDWYSAFSYLNGLDICLLIQILTGYFPASFLVEGTMVGTMRKAEPWGGGMCVHTRGESLHSFSELFDFYKDRLKTCGFLCLSPLSSLLQFPGMAQ